PVLKHNGDYDVSGKVKYYHSGNEAIGTQLENWQVKYIFDWYNKDTGEKPMPFPYPNQEHKVIVEVKNVGRSNYLNLSNKKC
ncbi:MAG: hypothetical protein ACRCSG_00130, partial [Cellulosilyticaceae bacterium]